MGQDTCDKCVHCTHIAEEPDGRYYFCEICSEYIAEWYALDEEVECETYEQELDDNQTERSNA